MDDGATENISELIEGIAAGNRRALSQALSLIESSAESDASRIAALLSSLPKPPGRTRRIGVTGAPGVGKSTLLETLGLQLVEAGSKVAVLAVDPSSKRTGGSILGDKVRMHKLSLSDDAFVRPSPSRLALGGAASATRDAITVCEAAGYDTIIVETVGVGQSEIETADMVDIFLLLALPSAGDDVQGIKRGIMEVADAVILTKSDLSSDASRQAGSLYRSALSLLLPSRPNWKTDVVSVSAMEPETLRSIHEILDAFFNEERQPDIDQERQRQRITWFEQLTQNMIAAKATSNRDLAERLSKLRSQVREQDTPVTVAVHEFIRTLTISFSEAP